MRGARRQRDPSERRRVQAQDRSASATPWTSWLGLPASAAPAQPSVHDAAACSEVRAWSSSAGGSCCPGSAHGAWTRGGWTPSTSGKPQTSRSMASLGLAVPALHTWPQRTTSRMKTNGELPVVAEPEIHACEAAVRLRSETAWFARQPPPALDLQPAVRRFQTPSQPPNSGRGLPTSARRTVPGRGWHCGSAPPDRHRGLRAQPGRTVAETDWVVTFQLRSSADPSLVIDASELWKTPCGGAGPAWATMPRRIS